MIIGAALMSGSYFHTISTTYYRRFIVSQKLTMCSIAAR